MPAENITERQHFETAARETWLKKIHCRQEQPLREAVTKLWLRTCEQRKSVARNIPQIRKHPQNVTVYQR